MTKNSFYQQQSGLAHVSVGHWTVQIDICAEARVLCTWITVLSASKKKEKRIPLSKSKRADILVWTSQWWIWNTPVRVDDTDSKRMLCLCEFVFVWTCFSVLCCVSAGVRTPGCSSWVWSQGSGGRWLCSAGSVTGSSVRCGHLSTFPTYTVLGKLNNNTRVSVVFSVVKVISYGQCMCSHKINSPVPVGFS